MNNFFTKLRKSHNKAFVLLYAILVSSVVIAIGFSLINIVTKQIILSSVGKMSRVAYYAADGGRACGLFWHKYGEIIGRGLYYTATPGQNINCTGTSISVGDDDGNIGDLLSIYGINNSDISSNSKSFNFSQDMSIDTGDGTKVPACSKVSVLTFDPSVQSTYKVIVLSRGFSDICSNITSGRTIGRTVLTVVRNTP